MLFRSVHPKCSTPWTNTTLICARNSIEPLKPLGWQREYLFAHTDNLLVFVLGLATNPILIRQLKDVLQMAKTKSKTLIILGCRIVLPPELERELTVIEFDLPGKQELGAVLAGIIESAGIKSMETETREKVIDAASGQWHHGSGQQAPLNPSFS